MQVCLLIKFFAEEEHAHQFMAGKVYMNRLSYFKRVEDADNATRSDPNEAVWAWLQPPGIKINLTVPGIGAVEITEKDLAGPVSMGFAEHDDMHVFCIYALLAPGYPDKDGKLDLTPAQVVELEALLKIDDRCREFGRFAVLILQPQAFLERLRAPLLKQGKRFIGKLVEYYDEETFNGEFPLKDAPFRKQKRFAHQQEYRICLSTGTPGDNHIVVDMGDISDIAVKTEAALLRFQLHLEPIPDPA